MFQMAPSSLYSALLQTRDQSKVVHYGKGSIWDKHIGCLPWPSTLLIYSNTASSQQCTGFTLSVQYIQYTPCWNIVWIKHKRSSTTQKNTLKSEALSISLSVCLAQVAIPLVCPPCWSSCNLGMEGRGYCRPGLHPKWHLFLVHYLSPVPYGPWSKVVNYIGNHLQTKTWIPLLHCGIPSEA